MLRSPPRSYLQVANEAPATTRKGGARSNSLVENQGELSNKVGLPRPLVLDFECSDPSRRPSPKIVGDFKVSELGLKSIDIVMIGQAGGPKNTVRVITKKEINVSERFGSSLQFERAYDEVTWRCSIRGGSSVSALRFLNVQYFASNEELLEAIRPFAISKSEVCEEVFAGNTLIDGIWNGHKRVGVEIKSLALIPNFVMVRGRKIFIQHRDQIRRCYRCNEEGHIGKDCPSDVQEKINVPPLLEEEMNVIEGHQDLEKAENIRRIDSTPFSSGHQDGDLMKGKKVCVDNLSSHTKKVKGPKTKEPDDDDPEPSSESDVTHRKDSNKDEKRSKIPSKLEARKT